MSVHSRALPRQLLDEGLSWLADKYPSCFFVNGHARRPLKKTVLTDLQKEGADADVLSSAEFYMNSWEYLRSLLAGAERVDLNGKKSGTVTPQEQLDAEKRIAAEKAAVAKTKVKQSNPVAVLQKLHAARKIPDDAM